MKHLDPVVRLARTVFPFGEITLAHMRMSDTERRRLNCIHPQMLMVQRVDRTNPDDVKVRYECGSCDVRLGRHESQTPFPFPFNVTFNTPNSSYTTSPP